MISISGKKWIERKTNKNSIEKIKQDYKFSYLLSKLIISRNFNLSEINAINNNLKVTNVFKNIKDFNESSDLLMKSIQKKEVICILGDYDVDGACSTSLLIK